MTFGAFNILVNEQQGLALLLREAAKAALRLRLKRTDLAILAQAGKQIAADARAELRTLGDEFHAAKDALVRGCRTHGIPEHPLDVDEICNHYARVA